jgi:hypothetical protein
MTVGFFIFFLSEVVDAVSLSAALLPVRNHNWFSRTLPGLRRGKLLKPLLQLGVPIRSLMISEVSSVGLPDSLSQYTPLKPLQDFPFGKSACGPLWSALSTHRGSWGTGGVSQNFLR